MAEYPNLLPRFLKYVKVNSRSDEHSDRFPSTEREENFQKNVIMKDLEELGLKDVHYNQKSGCVIATIPSNIDYEVPTFGLLNRKLLKTMMVNLRFNWEIQNFI